ncbi:unnamed protein product [Gordionus sp. m RMFG-2023]
MKASIIILGMLFVLCCFYINSGAGIKYKQQKYDEDDRDGAWQYEKDYIDDIAGYLKNGMKVMKTRGDYGNDYIDIDEDDYLYPPPETHN